MSTITTINSSDLLEPTSRAAINTNFTNLNTDKAELASPIFITQITIQSAAGANPTFIMIDDDVAHGMTDILPTSQIFRIRQPGTNSGGGLMDFLTATDVSPVYFRSYNGATNPASAGFYFLAGKKSGTGATDLAAGEIHSQWVKNDGTVFVTLLGSGFLGIGVTPSVLFHVAGGSGVASFFDSNSEGIRVRRQDATRYRMSLTAASTGSTITSYDDTGGAYRPLTLDALSYTIRANNSDVITIATTGGIQLGSPTGGDKGAGTINAAGDIYKNNSAYTNPDYALEYWATGKVKKFKKNIGAKDYRRMTLEELESHIRENYRLPGITNRGMGIFGRGDFILEKVEELFTHLIDLNKKIAAL